MGRSTGDVRRSATTLDNLGKRVKSVTSRREWRTVRPLFEQLLHADGPFAIPAWDAARMATVLNAAAHHPDMPSDWGNDAWEIAGEADRAAAAGQPWEWR